MLPNARKIKNLSDDIPLLKAYINEFDKATISVVDALEFDVEILDEYLYYYSCLETIIELYPNFEYHKNLDESELNILGHFQSKKTEEEKRLKEEYQRFKYYY